MLNSETAGEGADRDMRGACAPRAMKFGASGGELGLNLSL
jgi:hypothetical protein